MIDNITVIIRSANERTIIACEKLVLEEVDKENVFVIAEKPFSQAVVKTFEIGLKRNKKWTLALDADLIVLPNPIKQLIESAKAHTSNLYVYQGLILDKFRGSLKYGGPHLYLTESLRHVEKYIPEIRDEIRPESYLYNKMKADGFQIVIEEKLFALHDFFQSYEDIYRKAYFHGIKHSKWANLFTYWLKSGKEDFDFRVFMNAFIEGYYSNNKVYPDINAFGSSTKAFLKIYLKTEKDELSDSMSSDKIFEIISAYNIVLNKELFVIKEKSNYIKRIKNKLLFLKK